MPRRKKNIKKNKIKGGQQQQCRAQHDRLFRGRPLLPLPERIRTKFFDCADGHTYFTREEFGDGSCFFHSVATLLNLHHDASDSDPARLQREVLSNIRHKIQCRLDTANGGNMLECFDFMDRGYTDRLGERERRQLGLRLRNLVKDAVDTRWDSFWSQKTKQAPHLLNRVYDKPTVVRMLQNPGVWADVYTILFSMHVLDVNILFLDQNRANIYCGVQGERMREQPTIFVMWVDNSHFQPILRLTCDADGHPRVKGVFRYGEDRIVDHIFRVWQKEDRCDTVSLGAVLM